jgi:hypothetical protein
MPPLLWTARLIWPSKSRRFTGDQRTQWLGPETVLEWAHWSKWISHLYFPYACTGLCNILWDRNGFQERLIRVYERSFAIWYCCSSERGRSCASEGTVGHSPGKEERKWEKLGCHQDEEEGMSKQCFLPLSTRGDCGSLLWFSHRICIDDLISCVSICKHLIQRFDSVPKWLSYVRVRVKFR